MSTQPNPGDYVRYTLWSAGFHPTDEIVNQIYATGHPYLAVDALLSALRAYPPTNKALEFMDNMRKITDGTYRTIPEQFEELRDRLNRLGEDTASDST